MLVTAGFHTGRGGCTETPPPYMIKKVLDETLDCRVSIQTVIMGHKPMIAYLL